MDKYEYQVCADQIKALCSEGRYAEAMDIADSIDWRRVKSFSMLCTVSEIYKVNKHYDESREILLLAYERYPDRASVIYALCELDIKLGDLSEAKAFYKEYVALKPNDTNKYVLLYRLYEAMDYTLEDKIALLEEFKRYEYTEKWAYELAFLYHQTGQETKCVETCDELILWFGEGNYVRKAMELKMQHAQLTEEQQRKYDGVAPVYSYTPQAEPEQNTVANDFLTQEIYQQQQPYPQQNSYAQPQPGYQYYGQEAYQYANYTQQQQPYQGQYNQAYPPNYDSNYQGIQVQPVGTGKYSTINLQEELAKNMQEFYDRGNVQPGANYYGETAPLYELSQQEYMQQLEQAGAIIQEEPADSEVVESTPETLPVVEQNSIEMPVVEEAIVPDETAAEPIEEAPVQEAPIAQPVVQEVPVQQTVVQEVVVPQMSAQPMMQNELQPGQPMMQNVHQSGQPMMQNVVQPGQPMMQNVHQPGQPEGQKDLERVLAQEYDGQISLSLPEPDPEIKQITGQIDISDFLKEWELKKQSAKQHSIQETRKRQMEQTNDIMSQLVGVIPGFEIEKEEEQNKEPEITTPVDEVVKQDEQGTVTKTTMKAPIYDARPAQRVVKRTETGSIINGPLKSGITEAIPNALPSASKKEEVTEEVPEVPEVIEELPKMAEVAVMVTEEAPEAIEELPKMAEEAVMVTEEAPEVIEELPKMAEEAVMVAEKAPEAIEELPKMAKEATEEEPVKYPFQVTDYGEAEEIEDIEQPDEVDDMLKTGAIPLFDIDQANYEAGLESNYKDDDKRPNVPSYMVLDEKREARREFDEIEMRIFGRFEGIESLKAQIVDVMDDMSMEAATGNVIVTGSEIYGRKSLAIDIVKAIQAVDSNFSGKVAKISGEALNKKDIPMTLHKLRNGALIVESAGGLTPVTINLITDALIQGAEPILVVFEDEKDAMEPLLSGCKELKTVFGARIEMDDFSNEDLVCYAKGYARELEYSIDEMGELALHTRITELQASIDDVVTVDDVIDIVDAAIHHVDRKNMSHFMDVLLAKRYDDDDYIILREKDFIE